MWAQLKASAHCVDYKGEWGKWWGRGKSDEVVTGHLGGSDG